MKLKSCVFFLLFVCTLFNVSLADIHKKDYGSVDLIPLHFGKQAEFMLAFDLAPGWKVYSPDNNQSDYLYPSFTITGSENVSSINWFWPKAKTFSLFGEDFSAYHKKFHLKAVITPVDPSKNIVLKLNTTLSACNTICVYDSFDFEITLQPGFSTPIVSQPIPHSDLALNKKVISIALPEHLHSDQLLGITSIKPAWLASIMIIALLGGLILNLMPCVLPVLSLKLNAFIKDPKHIRSELIATSLGIIVSFLLMGIIIGLLQNVGIYILVGIQFQSQLFLILSTFIFAIMGLSLLGAIKLRLPETLNHRINRLIDNTKSARLKSFLIGFFAALVAAPCSAPILSTALAATINTDLVLTSLIFSVMGLGMAAPYFLAMLLPKSLKYLPKPGKWLNILKKAIAVTLLVSAAWFAWLLAYKSLNRDITVSKDEYWQEFNYQKIKELNQEGRDVLVNVTAEWCLLCKVNKKRVFSNKRILGQLAAHNFYLMEADFTDANQEVERLLIDNNRRGIPFTAIYYHDGRVEILPELLRREDLIKSFPSRIQK